MNWEIGIDMSTLMGIKLMTNKNLLYKKINKIQKKKKKKRFPSGGLICQKDTLACLCRGRRGRPRPWGHRLWAGLLLSPWSSTMSLLKAFQGKVLHRWSNERAIVLPYI